MKVHLTNRPCLSDRPLRRECRRRPAWQMATLRALILPALALLLGGAVLPAEALPARPIPVRFVWEGEGGAAAARSCQEALDRQGDEMASALLPATGRADTVHCLLLTSAGFRRRFAGAIPDWGIGVALPGGRVVALDYENQRRVGRGLQEIFLHELAHAVMLQRLGEVWAPAWFHEGAAQWLSGEWRFADTVNLILDGTVPPLDRLQHDFPRVASWAGQAYRASLLAITYLRRWHGDDAVRRIVTLAAENGDFEGAFTVATGESTADFSRRFGNAIQLRFGWLITLTRWPSLFALMAVLFLIGAIMRFLRTRRRLAAMPDD
jgi:hypothetical protein